MHKTELLDKYARDGDSRLLLARVLDQWQRAEQRGVPTHTGFLSPAEQAVSADLLMAAAPGQGILAGGYPDAERRLWAFLPDWLEEETLAAGGGVPSVRPGGGDPAGGRPHPPGLSGLPHGPGPDPGEAGGYSPLPTGGPGGGAAGGAAHSPVPVGEGGAVPGAG